MKAPPKLSPLMEKALAKVGLEWAPLPYNVLFKTLEALESRRLVQIRNHRFTTIVDGWRTQSCTQWQVRRSFPEVSAREPWTVGWVPAGWRRGDCLDIAPSAPERHGYPRRMGAVHWVPDLSTLPINTVNPTDVAYVSFSPEEAKKVDEWLKWWRA